MIKAPTGKQIKIIQNIQLRNRQDDGDQFRKKPRLTSSMLLLEEEPVISDSDEERELIKTIFGTIQPVKNTCLEAIKCDILTGRNKTIPVKDKCDAEVQCDLLTPEKTLYGLINQCSKLNSDDVGDFKGVIKSCEKFIARRSFIINEADALSDISYVSKNDARYCSPARNEKKENEKTKPNDKLKRGIVSSNECRRKSNREASKKIQVKSGRTDPFSSTQIFDSTFKKPFEVDVGNALETTGSSENVIKVKSLARNWMKPHKSFCSYEEDLKPKPHFVSLQCKKTRRLYSPSQWMLSQDFVNSCSTKN